MSLSDRAGARIRSIPVLAGVLLLTALAGCQVRPLYSDAVGTSTALAAIEISDARWFSRAEIRAVAGGDPEAGFSIPMRSSIAHFLIMKWLDDPVA